MAYNFKSIADVEVVAEPAESANVLIEENGVIKKAPKTAVGGAGEEADLVIRLNQHPMDTSLAPENISIVSGSVEAVYDAFENGLMPKVEVEVIVLPNVNSYVRACYKVVPQIIFYGDFLFVNFVCSIYGENPCAAQITFNSSDNYALSNYAAKQITTTAL